MPAAAPRLFEVRAVWRLAHPRQLAAIDPDLG